MKVSEADIRELHPPTFLIYGTQSYDIEPSIMKRLIELRPDIKCFIAEGASHNVHRDKPDLVNAAISSFLGV